MRTRFALCAATFLVLASTVNSFAEPVIDGSSRDSFERSAKAMVDSLPESERDDFGKALLNMILTRYPAASGAEGLALLSLMPAAMESAHITMDGVEMSEILERAKEIANTSDQSETPVEVVADDGLIGCLRSKITLSNARIKDGDFSPQVGVDVTNNLPFAISAIRYQYRVISEGRSIPWVDDVFSIEIPGGIEPNETRYVGSTIYNLNTEVNPELKVSVTLLDVADPEKRLMIGDVRIIGWPDEPSVMICQE